MNYLITKLVNIGAFPPSPPTTISQPSFWETNLPHIRQKLFGLPEPEPYCVAWQKLALSIPSSITLRSVLTSLFASLKPTRPSTDPSEEKRIQVKAEAQLLAAVLGGLNEDEDQLWETTTSLILSRDWEESYARIFVCWLVGPNDPQHINTKGTLHRLLYRRPEMLTYFSSESFFRVGCRCLVDSGAHQAFTVVPPPL